MAGRALVVGVPHTTFGGSAFPPLAGVADDVAAVTALLEARGFSVTRLGPEPAPHVDEVASCLASFVDGVAPGDLGVVYLAGHGYRTPDTSGDEEDHWDEAFVCGDRAIPDDWFREQLWVRARPGA